MPLLELQGVSLAFGGLKVVDELDLHVDEGEIVVGDRARTAPARRRSST